MRQTLILHIGSHKTGSTTIQNYFYWNRLWLKRFGVFYPRPLKPMHRFATSQSDLRDAARSEGQLRYSRTNPRTGGFEALLDDYIRVICDAKQPLNILSCEGWSSQLDLYAKRMMRLSEHFDVRVVAFVRRPDYFIESLYRQRVLNPAVRETRSFAEFVSAPGMQQAILGRAEIMSWWEAAFGLEAVRVLPFEPAVPNFDLLGRFMAAAEVPDGVARHLPLRNARARRSASAAEVEVVRLCNSHEIPVDARLAKQLRSAVGSRHGGYLTPVDRTLLLGRAAFDMHQIRDRYVRDGRATLFPQDPEDRDQDQVWNRVGDPSMMAGINEVIRERG